MIFLKTVTRRSIAFGTFACAALALTALAPATDAYAAKKLRLSHLSPPGSDMDKWAHEFAKQVKAKTDGRITVRIYPASQLGDWEEVYGQLSQGSVDLAIQSISTKFDQRLAITWFPYTAVDYDSARKAWNVGGFLYKIVNDLVKPQQINVLAPYAFGLGGMAVGKDVKDPKNPDADNSNLKIRVWPSGVPTHKPTLERLGYSTTTMPWAELYTGVQTGVIDGMVGGVPENAVRDWNGVVKTWLQINDHFEINWLLASTLSFSRVDEKDRKIILEIAKELATQRFNTVETADQKYLDKLRKDGVKVVTYSRDEIEKLAAAVRKDAWPKMKSAIGDELFAVIQKHYGK